MSEIIAAADGSALGNPGPAGWAWYIDDNHWAAGGWEHGTNNMGELKAVLDLFEATAHMPERKLVVYCDSQYVINSLTKWMPGWKSRGWKKADGKPVLNRELLQELDAATAGRDYQLVWVKGHSGHELNEAADARANAAAQAYQQGNTPDAGPGFGAAAGASSRVSGGQAPAAEAEPEQGPSADAHLSVEEFTIEQAQQAREGFNALKLNGVLKPASAVAAPDPQAVAERKEKLAQAAQRAERQEQAAHVQSPQQTQQQLTADPDEALAAEEELEANGAAMGEEEIAELLDENLVWITSAGRPVSRASTIEYRARAFTQRGEPTHRVVELVDTANVLVMAVVDTARGRVNRSSLWHYDAPAGSWRLRFRQDTAIPG